MACSCEELPVKYVPMNKLFALTFRLDGKEMCYTKDEYGKSPFTFINEPSFIETFIILKQKTVDVSKGQGDENTTQIKYSSGEMFIETN